jgi:hypothetical protein
LAEKTFPQRIVGGYLGFRTGNSEAKSRVEGWIQEEAAEDRSYKQFEGEDLSQKEWDGRHVLPVMAAGTFPSLQ